MAGLIDLPDGSILFVATTADDGSQAWIKVGDVVSNKVHGTIDMAWEECAAPEAPILDASYVIRGSVDFKPFSANFQSVLDALVSRQGSMGLSPLGTSPRIDDGSLSVTWPSLRAMGPGFGVSDKLGYNLEDDE